MANKSISQLDTAAIVDNGDLFEIAQPDISSASGYKSYKQSMAVMADHIANDVIYTGLHTTAQSLVGAINEVQGIIVTGTLVAGNTSITLSNAGIHTTSTIDIYTDTFGINPTAVTVAEGSVTLTFDAQASDVAVKVKVV